MRVVILGAGPAGVTVAEGLRALEPESRGPPIDLTMVSTEPYAPYSPPAMADHFLNGREAPLFWKGTDVCERLGVRYLSGVAASRVEAADRRVVLDDGRALDYDQLVVATGSRLHAPIEGIDLPGRYDFKSLAAAEALIAHVEKKEIRSAIVVGGGFIGVEVSLLLADLGLDVTLLQRRWVMARMLDSEVGDIVQDILRKRRVKTRLYAPVQGFVGERRVEAVRLESGEVLEADAYVAATGVKPNVELLAGSGIDVSWGVVVDDGLHTNLPGVWAAGDVAETRDRMTGERYVHAIFPNAVEQGRVVAARILGRDVPYEGAESMNSMKHLGVPLITAGRRSGGEELRWRRRGALRKVVLDEEDRIVGFTLFGDIRGAGHLRSLMLKRERITAPAERILEPVGALAAMMRDGAASGRRSRTAAVGEGLKLMA